MIINDLNVLGPALAPYEAYAPLAIDADRVLPPTIAFQGLQSVSRRRSKVVKRPGGVQKQQLAPGLPFDRPEARHAEIREQTPGGRIPE